jgi:hypothetical protein
MRKTIFGVAVGVLVLLLLVCAFFLSGSRGTGPVRMTAVFNGFTNGATGARFAAFRVSNPGGPSLYLWPFYAVEESGQAVSLLRSSFGQGVTLVPGQSAICLLPAPDNKASWRVVLDFSRNDWRRRLGGAPAWIRWLLPSRHLVIPVSEAFSDWVGAEGSVPPQPGVRQRMAAVVLRAPTGHQTNSTAVAPLPQKP